MSLSRAEDRRRPTATARPARSSLGAMNTVIKSVRLAPAVLALAVLIAGAGIVSTPTVARAAETGVTLTGTVRGSAGENLVHGAHVIVYRDGVGIASSIVSNLADGKYVVSGLAPGDYDVLVTYCCTSNAYIGEWGDGTHGGKQQRPTKIVDGTNTLDFVLDAGGYIDGTLTGSGEPLSGEFTVVPMEPVLPGPAVFVRVSSGKIFSSPLPPGRYGLIANAGPQWVPADQNGVQGTTPTEPALVVSLGKTASLNVDLAPAGQITGTVYVDNRDGTRSPLAGASVTYKEYDNNPNGYSWGVTTDANGRYIIRGLSGRFLMSFVGPSGSETLQEFYGGAREPKNPQLVMVRDNALVSGIDATLDQGGRIAVSPWFQPAPGRDFISSDGNTAQSTTGRIGRLDEQSGLYKYVPNLDSWHGGWTNPTGLLEPGIYSVHLDVDYPVGNPYDPATPTPLFSGERTDIVVRAGQTTHEGKLVLETDFYPPPPPGGSGPTPTAPGTFKSLLPARLLDTRDDRYFDAARLDPYQTSELQVTGRGGIPAAGVAAVVMNVTVTEPSASGFVTVYPAGGAQPFASNLNFTPGQTIPNLVTVKVGASGKVAIANNSAGTAHVLADVAGYYLSGTPSAPGAFVSVEPGRLLDTRIGVGASKVAVGPNQSVQLQLTGKGDLPASGIAAVTMNVTVTEPTSSGFVTVYPAGSTQPTASNLNFTAGQSTPNLVTVKVGDGGKVTLTNNSGGTVHLIADVAGYHLSGPPAAVGAFVSVDPLRLLDTRVGTGTSRTALAANESVELQVTGKGGIPAAGVVAVSMNVTATQSSTSGFISVNPSGLKMTFPSGSVRRSTSNLNFIGGQNIPNFVVVQIGEGGRVRLTNNSSGTVHLIADVAGYYLSGPPTTG